MSEKSREKSGAAAFIKSFNMLREMVSRSTEERFTKDSQSHIMIVVQLFDPRQKAREMDYGYSLRCVLRCLLFAIRTKPDELFDPNDSTNARQRYRINKAFVKPRLLPDPLSKICHLARSLMPDGSGNINLSGYFYPSKKPHRSGLNLDDGCRDSLQ